MSSILRIFLRQRYDLKRLYDRQLRIDGIDQERISKAKIAIIGIGETGSHSAIYSAHAGIGCIRLCDFDVVKIHNVPRMLGVTVKDVGKYKTEVVANAIRKLGNGTRVETYNVEARHVPQRFFEDLDLSIICVYRISTRFEVGEILWSRCIPHIDIGIRDLLLNVMEFLPNGKEWPCMFCMRQIIPENQLQFSNNAKSCDEEPIPTILPPGAIASAIAVNEALKILTDFKLVEPCSWECKLASIEKSLTDFKRNEEKRDMDICNILAKIHELVKSYHAILEEMKKDYDANVQKVFKDD